MKSESDYFSRSNVWVHVFELGALVFCGIPDFDGLRVGVAVGAGEGLDGDVYGAGALRHDGDVDAARLARVDDEEDVVLAGAQLRVEAGDEAVRLQVDELVVVAGVEDDEALDALRLEVEGVHAHADLLAQARLLRHLDLTVPISH